MIDPTPIHSAELSDTHTQIVDRRHADYSGGRAEPFALIALILIAIVLPLALLGYQFALRPALADIRTIDILAAAPEAGGFSPDTIRVAAGERVRLRFSVSDVTHGIAVGPGLGLDVGQIDPGQVKEVEVSFDRPGRYTMYCNTWCSPNHWRMRGTIEVYDPGNPNALSTRDTTDPVLEELLANGVDIDAQHLAGVVRLNRPSAARGMEIVRKLEGRFPAELLDFAWRRTHSPVEAWTTLVGHGVDGAQAWDAVAYLWLMDLDSETQQLAQTLYAKNCAACHGEAGDARGAGADALIDLGIVGSDDMHMAGEPTAFADPSIMLGGSNAVYYAKLRRGGMGTGMPGFGPVFTPDETWALVSYLWTFVFDP
jgi:mono/diheme cytochrome c family protein/plastocyanin